jgi:oligopeptide transport system substrate-binding protein
MKRTYLIAIVIVSAMILSPWVLLPDQGQSDFAGVVLYDVYGSKIKSMDPATCGDTSSGSIQTNIYEGLYTYSFLLRPIEVVPSLADDLPTISDDGLTYTIPIRKNVYYSRNACFGLESDGTTPATREVTAQDFVLALKRVADPHIVTSLSYALISGRIVGLDEYREQCDAYYKGDFSRYDNLSIAGIQAIDDHTLEIRLTRPFPQFLYVLAMHNYAPIPQEVVDYHLAQHEVDGKRVPLPVNQRDPEIRKRKAVVGTGPYLLTEWIRAGKIVMKKNPTFREERYPTAEELLAIAGDTPQARAHIAVLQEQGLLRDAGKRLPLIDVRNLTYVEETNPAWMMFEHKRRDTAGIPRDVYNEVITPDKNLMADWKRKGVELEKYTSPSIFWLAFNNEDKYLKNRSLRQAINLCYDVEQHIEVLFNGRGLRAVNTIPRSFKGWKQAGPSPYARVDLDLAKQKLAQALRELRADGTLKPDQDLPPLTLDLPSKSESYRRMGEFAQNQFARIGLKLEIRANDWPTLQKKVHNKRVQIYAMGWRADYPDAENFLQLYYSPNIRKGTNNTNYNNPEFDRLFEQAATIAEEDRRVELYVKMIRILNEDCPVLLLSEPINYVLYYKWVHNIYPHPIGYGYGKYTRIDTRLRRKMGGRN